MARLLIASRSMALALRLADAHEVVEHPADNVHRLAPGDDIDVVVLDVGEPALALETVQRLRDQGSSIPMLLVSGYQPEWSGVAEMALDGVEVVPLPITRAALLSGIGRLTGDLVEDVPAPGRPPTPPPQAAPPPGAWTASPTPTAETLPPSRTPPTSAPVTGSVTATGPNAAPQTPPGGISRRPVLPGGAPAGVRPARPPAGRGPLTPRGGLPLPAPPSTATPGRTASLRTGASGPAAESAPPVTHEEDSGADGPTPDGPAPESPAPESPTPENPAPESPTQEGPAPESTSQEGPAPDGTPPEPPAAKRPTAERPSDGPAPGLRPIVAGASERAQPDQPAEPTRVQPVTRPIRLPPTPVQPQPVNLAPPQPLKPAPYPARVEPVGTPPHPTQARQGPRHAPGTPGPRRPTSGSGRRLPLLGGRLGRGQGEPTARGREGAEEGPDTGNPFLAPGQHRDPDTDPFLIAPPEEPNALASSLEERVARESKAATAGSIMRTADLVRMVLDRASELYGVADTAQVLADDVVERADADAAAVLVPDGPVWRVSGGVGLRPLERRLVLDDSHWLIAEIAATGRAVLIEDTDIIRQQLAGAPLAAWRHLLAVPVPDVRAAVVLARGQEAGPFTDEDLTAVVAPVREAAGLLAQAVETRRLARLLGPLREADAEAPLRRPIVE